MSRLRLVILVVSLLLVGVVLGLGVSYQMGRTARCQQLSAQYVSALSATGEITGQLRTNIAATRDAYQRSCS
jgi:hypothetical protein